MKTELEEAAENHHNTFTKDLSYAETRRESFMKGAKWQSKRMYSGEEVIAIVEKSRETGLTAEYLLLTEKFKK
jgi:hypothetical protein